MFGLPPGVDIDMTVEAPASSPHKDSDSTSDQVHMYNTRNTDTNKGVATCLVENELISLASIKLKVLVSSYRYFDILTVGQFC